MSIDPTVFQDFSNESVRDKGKRVSAIQDRPQDHSFITADLFINADLRESPFRADTHIGERFLE